MTCTTNSERAATPEGTGAASTINGGKCTACACENQPLPMTRKDTFAAIAFHGILATAKSGEEAAKLMGLETLRACYYAGHLAECLAQAEIGGTR
jgi:hypothetical protein